MAEEEQEEEESIVLIPGLPEEVGMLCLARLPFGDHPRLSCVCRSWRRALQLPLLFHLRSRLGLQEHFLFVLLLEQPGPSPSTTQCFLMDCRSAECYPLPPPPLVRGRPYAHGCYCNVIALGRQVLILPALGDSGDWSPHGPDALEPICFDLVSRRWCTQPPPMLDPRSWFASATVDGYVYAAGGQSNLDFLSLKSAERFDIASKKWERIPDMREKRHGARGVAWKGSFCVLGGWKFVLSEGRTSLSHISVDSADVWDALKEEWQLIPDFFPFDMEDVASVKGKLYALKNLHEEKVLMSLDEKTNSWILLGNLDGPLREYVRTFYLECDSGAMITVGDELWIFVIDCTTSYKCGLFATDPEIRPLCWRYLPLNCFTNRSNVCDVTI